MKKTSNILILISLCVTILSCVATKETASKSAHEVRNVILMIGDGMGLPDVYAAMTVSDKPLNIESVRHYRITNNFFGQQLYN